MSGGVRGCALPDAVLLRGSGRHYSARAAGWYQLSGWLVPLLPPPLLLL
eukprot:COSAG01_NODE_2926_length_6839_cov_5.363353_7_plen_49_part_00